MIDVADHPDGVVFAVRAQPSARKNAVLGAHDGALKVAVTAPPQDGRANTAIIDLLRESLGLRRSQIEIVSGQKDRNKRFLVRGVTRDWLAKALSELV